MKVKAGKLIVNVILPALFLVINLTNAYAATNQFKGVNWADQRDNFQSGVLYVSGLSSTDTYASASIVADKVVSGFMSLIGSNTVRMPINEATVSGYWGTYTGAIDMALTKGKVILAYWAVSGGRPADMTAFWNMWATVVNKYGSNGNAYFEIINEPAGYSGTDLCNMYYTWCTTYSSVPQSRIILDGSGYAQYVPDVGVDTRLSNCLLAVHEYSFWGNFYSESSWMSHFQGEVGSYSSRTVCTEWGYPNSPGTKDGVSYGSLNYSAPDTSNYFICYARGIAAQLNSWSMGSCYWPGLRDADWYSMTIKSGTGSGISLSIPNASGLAQLKIAWGGSASTDPPSNTIAPTNPPTDTAAPTDTPAPTSIPTVTPAGVTPDPTAPPSETAAPTTAPSETTPPSTGCTCANLCSSQTSITVPFTKDGAGEFCYVSSSIGSYVNSWNCDAVNVNGTSCTNTYVSSSSIPANGGVYYIYYKASYSWSHLEIK